jgi:hypothetical protein
MKAGDRGEPANGHRAPAASIDRTNLTLPTLPVPAARSWAHRAGRGLCWPHRAEPEWAKRVVSGSAAA